MDKKEYIDREALIRYTEKQEVIIKDGTSIADAMRIQGNVFRRCVETCPAADVAPVVHGEWVYHERVSSYDGVVSGYSCSCCCAFIDEEVFDNTSLPIKYCPNCGAKMDGGKHG